jgi:hypothetical protein
MQIFAKMVVWSVVKEYAVWVEIKGPEDKKCDSLKRVKTWQWLSSLDVYSRDGNGYLRLSPTPLQKTFLTIPPWIYRVGKRK